MCPGRSGTEFSPYCGCFDLGDRLPGHALHGGTLQLDFAARELTIKLVYYGPALSGKTTNLRSLHELVSQTRAGA